MQAMSPLQQINAAKFPERAYFGFSPTLAEINTAYGDNTAVMWLLPQINSVSRYCGVKEKMTDEVTLELASTIASTYFYLKASELMLFFQRLKNGVYGKFFGSVDPMVIVCALRDFLRERNLAYYEKDKKEARLARESNTDEVMTYEEYKRRKEAECTQG